MVRVTETGSLSHPARRKSEYRDNVETLNVPASPGGLPIMNSFELGLVTLANLAYYDESRQELEAAIRGGRPRNSAPESAGLVNG